MNNEILNINDTLVVNVQPNITGKIRLTSYADVLDGLTETRFVEREFRISTNGIFWSDWTSLTNDNISNKVYYVSENLVNIQIKYTRLGTDSTDKIVFHKITFYGNVEAVSMVSPIVNNSIFSNFQNSEKLRNIEQNLFKKLYYRGIIPAYIERGENDSETEDEDFIDLFFSIAKFFGLSICFSKQFESFLENSQFLKELLRQYNLYFNGNESLSELQFLLSHYLDEIRKRGTEIVLKRKSEEVSENDGEFVRLLQIGDSDELIYEYLNSNQSGWCLSSSSPLYKGISLSSTMNKYPRITKDILDNIDYIGTFSSDAENDYWKIDVSNGSSFLIGNIDANKVKPELCYNIDVNIDYELVIELQLTNIEGDCSIEIGVEGYNSNYKRMSHVFISNKRDTLTNDFIKITNENNLLNTETYVFRGIIFSYSTISSQIKTNFGYGNNLIFNTRFVKFIQPKILFKTSSGETMTTIIQSIKLRPLNRGRNILPLFNSEENCNSLGFLESERFFYCYAKNNNKNQSQNNLTNIIDKYILPYNSTNVFILT